MKGFVIGTAIGTIAGTVLGAGLAISLALRSEWIQDAVKRMIVDATDRVLFGEIRAVQRGTGRVYQNYQEKK